MLFPKLTTSFASHPLSLFRVRHPTTDRFAIGKETAWLSPRRPGSQSAPISAHSLTEVEPTTVSLLPQTVNEKMPREVCHLALCGRG